MSPLAPFWKPPLTEEKEPDSREGWCEECERGTMVSALVLGGLI